MKVIDVLIQVANDEIKEKTTLKIYDLANYTYTYTFNDHYKAFF